MNFIRLIFITFLLTLSIGMLNYTIFDKLNYYYLAGVIWTVSIVFFFGDKLSLNYFKAKEVTSVEEPILLNYVKSIAFSKSIKPPRLYMYEGSYMSFFIVASLTRWSILLEKSLMQGLTKEQKFDLISGAMEARVRNPYILKTFGIAIQVVIFKILDLLKYKTLNTVINFFFVPINKLIEKLSNPKVKARLSRSLLEYHYRNIEIQKGFETLDSLIQKTPEKIEFQAYNILKRTEVSYE